MAGVKGRSGGARPGAGRKRKTGSAPRPAPTTPQTPSAPPDPAVAGTTDAKSFLEGVISGKLFATEEQISAAKALLPFQHKKLGEAGKKEQRKEAAGAVGGRFSPAPPRMAAAGAKRH